MGGTASVPVYTIEDVPGKGKGLIATQDIPKGTRIIAEKPFMTLSNDVASMQDFQARVQQQVSTLSVAQGKEFLTMDNVYPYANAVERWCGIFRTNALPVGPDLNARGVFSNACRINHACDANAQNVWNERLKALTIHVVRDILQGEEITIYYIQSRRNRRTRQKELQRDFNFMCACHLCSVPADERKASDARLERIYRIDCLIEESGEQALVSSARRMLGYVDEQVRLCNESAPDEIGLVRAYPDAFQLAVANGDLARARVFAERVLPLYQTSMGDDSPDVIEYKKLVRNPATHEYYGMSMKWKTAMEEAPQGLGPQEFEDWLWRRRKTTVSGQLANLRDRETFPSYNELPAEHDVESDYFEGGDMGARRPLRHWCFLAEIRNFSWLAHLQMDVKDVGGATVRLFFHTSRKGRELAQSQVQKGYTVAILYAVRHASMYSESGIRHENPQTIKIFPVSLNKLLRLGEDIREFSVELDGVRTCHGCGKKGDSFKRCGKCNVFWYCDEACQTADWLEKGHEAECKVLKDADLQAMLRLKWDEFGGRVRFPLRIKGGF